MKSFVIALVSVALLFGCGKMPSQKVKKQNDSSEQWQKFERWKYINRQYPYK